MSYDRLPNRLLGYLMMAVGGLIAALCGSCTLFLIGETVLQIITYETSTSFMPAPLFALPSIFIALLVGGAPTVAGVVLFVSGLRRAGLIGKTGRKPPYTV